MPQYVCRVGDDRGQITNRVEIAGSVNELRDKYAQQGVFLYSVRPRGGWRDLFGSGAEHKKIKLSEFLIFNQQFVTLIRAGLPILKSLELLCSHIAQPSLRSSILDIRERIKGGALLSEAFREQGIFPEIYTTSLMAGEKSGNLEEVLDRYIGYQKTALTVKKKLLASLVYPTLLIVMVIVLVTFLIGYVIPNFADLYRTMSADLPPLTVALISFTDAFRNYWFILVALLAGTAAGAWLWSRTDAGGQSIDRIKSRLPLIGSIWSKFQVAQFSRILGTLIAGGIPVVQALETARLSVTSPLLRHTLDVATRKVREGTPLWEGLSSTGFFPEMAIEMIQVGESSGALHAMLTGVSDFFEEDVNTVLAALLSLVEPAILIFMGLVVAFVLMALYMPIFSLSGQL